MLSKSEIVPVVMFHSVGLSDSGWIFAHISEPVKSFENKIEILNRSGYRFIFWNELYAHMAGQKKLSDKSIMLTFDDGYLDNWTYVFPILKKYGTKVTIFVNPEFVDPIPRIRPTLEDVNMGKTVDSELKAVGFLNWPEMRQMEASGLVDIQSHSLTHTWYYSGSSLKDFHRPGDHRFPWLAWNERPERKPYYMIEDQSTFVHLGTPVYEHEKALICKRYFPPHLLVKGLVDFVADNGGKKFFKSIGWEDQLKAHHEQLYKTHGKHARVENETEYRDRVFHELAYSKKMLEENLEKRIDYICWPGGGYNQTVLDLARQVGYKAWTLASKDRTDTRNTFGVGPEQVKRVGSFSKFKIPGRPPFRCADANYFLCAIERHRGSVVHTWLGRAMLAGAYFRNLIEKK